jgi:hypothetical protein
LDIFFGYDRSPIIGYEQQIGLYDIKIGKHHVHRCGEKVPTFFLLSEHIERPKKVPGDFLVLGYGGRRHEMLPIDQFMPIPVTGKQEIIFIGEFSGRERMSHSLQTLYFGLF